MTKEQFYAGRADLPSKLYVASIFETLDGETNKYHAGSWSVFVRLQGCRVGCRWCDTKYSWPIHRNGKHYTAAELFRCVQFSRAKKVTITGGEPMEQWGHALQDFLQLLTRDYRHVSMETSGCDDLQPVVMHYPFVNLIVDYKMPSAHVVRPMVMENFSLLRMDDVVKFVVELDEVKLIPELVRELRETRDCRARLVFSPLWEQSDQLKEFVEAARRNKLPALDVGMSLQTHKVIWPKTVRDEEGASL